MRERRSRPVRTEAQTDIIRALRSWFPQISAKPETHSLNRFWSAITRGTRAQTEGRENPPCMDMVFTCSLLESLGPQIWRSVTRFACVGSWWKTAERFWCGQSVRLPKLQESFEMASSEGREAWTRLLCAFHIREGLLDGLRSV